MDLENEDKEDVPKKNFQSIISKKILEIRSHNFVDNARRFGQKFMYLDNLIKYSELCLTGGLKSTAYANDLSDLCLNILRKDSQIWYQEFQYLEDIYELKHIYKLYAFLLQTLQKDQKIEYFLQNCLLVIENSQQDEKLILMSLTHLSCIDYPKDTRVLSIGARCISIIKNLLSRGDNFKELVEKSILDIVIQNIKENNWLDVKEIQINGIISFMQIPSISLLFLQDEEILPLMHRWIYQITEYIAQKQYFEEDKTSNLNRKETTETDTPNTQNVSRKTFTVDFSKALKILQLIEMCILNNEMLQTFCQDDTDKNLVLKMHFFFTNEIDVDLVKIYFQKEQFVIFTEFQIVVLSLIEKFNVQLEERLITGLRFSHFTSNLETIVSLSGIQDNSSITMPISDEKQSHSKPLSSEEVEKFLKFTMKDIDNQLRHKQMYLSSFLGQMETLLNTKENSKVMEKDKLTCQIKHFAQLIRSAGSFQGQIHLSYLRTKNSAELSQANKLHELFVDIYQIPVLDPLLVSACCSYIKFYLRYHFFEKVEEVRRFMQNIKNTVNLLQYIDIESKTFSEFIQLGQLYLENDVFFENFTNDMSEGTREYSELMVTNPVVLKAMHSIVDLFGVFYIHGSSESDIKLARKSLKLTITPSQLSKAIKKEVRDLLDLNQRKEILLNLLDIEDALIRVSACKQLLSIKTIKDDKEQTMNWTMKDLLVLLTKLNDLFNNQKGSLKQQDISFILLIFCKLFSEINAEQTQDVISEIGKTQFDILINILEEGINSSFVQNDQDLQSQSDLCLASVFLIRKLLNDETIQEQILKDSVLKRIKKCMWEENTLFSEQFPPLFSEKLCLNMSVLLETFENGTESRYSLHIFRIFKRLSDCLEGYAYSQQINEEERQGDSHLNELDNTFNKQNTKKEGTPQFQADLTTQSAKKFNRQQESEMMREQIKQLKLIQSECIKISNEHTNSLVQLINDLIKSIDQTRKGGMKIQNSISKQLNPLVSANSISQQKNNSIQASDPISNKRKVSVELGFPIKDEQKNREGAVKDFLSIRKKYSIPNLFNNPQKYSFY